MTIKQLNELGQDIFEKRYAYPGETKWSERAKVIARTVASAEDDENKEKYTKRFYDIIASGDFIPGGRIIFGTGRNGGRHNLLNCFFIEPGDSVPSIAKTISDTYTISCAGGGVGFNFSNIRPKGDDIRNIKYSAQGCISVMRLINEIGDHVKSGSNRRTALMSILDVSHPDLLEFLYVKLDKKELNNFNISVAITNRFIEACEFDEEWHFTFNNKKYYLFEMNRYTEGEGAQRIDVMGMDEDDVLGRAKEHHRKKHNDIFEVVRLYPLKAREIWEKIWTNALESGDPGIFNIDLAKSYTNVSYFSNLAGTNPCGEQILESYGNCCLGHINLANMVEDGNVNWNRLARSIREGVRFLDNVLTINHFPLEECKEVGHNSRRIGLGVTGLHYMLIELGIQYGSEKCLEFLDRLFATIRDEAYKESIYLARDKTAFPAFDYKQYLAQDFARTLPARIRMLIKRHGIRNAVLLTVAPTGTISLLMGVSSGIEPIFSAMYKRKYKDGNTWKETLVVDPMFKKHFEEGKDLKSFIGAYDISPEEHMQVQATIQRYIDSSISKTINVPEDFKAGKFQNQVIEFFRYLKGITIYRAGSKENEPLVAIPLTYENIEKYMGTRYDSAVAEGSACSMTGGGCD